MAYFLISVSSRENLELCIKHGLAGFTNSISGVWTFSDIQVGDYVSFLYGARAHNLYRVESKEALRDAGTIPPWRPITFRMSGLTYYFPFRLKLTPVRSFSESLVRPEFSYVAENLLLRGGYRKTHFQADQTTLQSVSQLGRPCGSFADALDLGAYQTFVPRFTKRKDRISPPEVFRLVETILQTVIRRHLSDLDHLSAFLDLAGVSTIEASRLEVLGEKALPQGHIDLLVKESIPIGSARQVIVEVKAGLARLQDVAQLTAYAREMGSECVGAVLIARGFSKKVLQEARSKDVAAAEYTLPAVEENAAATFDELRNSFRLASVP